MHNSLVWVQLPGTMKVVVSMFNKNQIYHKRLKFVFRCICGIWYPTYHIWYISTFWCIWRLEVQTLNLKSFRRKRTIRNGYLSALILASGRRSRPSRIKDRAWYHSNGLEKMIHLHPLDCFVMDVRWGKVGLKLKFPVKSIFDRLKIGNQNFW